MLRNTVLWIRIRIQGLLDPDRDFWLDPDSIEYGSETLVQSSEVLSPEDPFADVLEEPEDGVALKGVVPRREVVERHPAGPDVQLLPGKGVRTTRHLQKYPGVWWCRVFYKPLHVQKAFISLSSFLLKSWRKTPVL